MNKLIRDGKVAVLISPEYGAGWSTWNYDLPEILFDPEVVKMVEDKTDSETIQLYCDAKYPDHYFGGADDLEVKWLPIGTEFKVNEYDGFETLEIKDLETWIVA